MKDLIPHLGYFLVLAFAIVLMGAFYAEPENGPAFRSLPRRFLIFVLSCAAVAGVMLLCETFFASV